MSRFKERDIMHTSSNITRVSSWYYLEETMFTVEDFVKTR